MDLFGLIFLYKLPRKCRCMIFIIFSVNINCHFFQTAVYCVYIDVCVSECLYLVSVTCHIQGRITKGPS
jgi:hypothetical protein